MYVCMYVCMDSCVQGEEESPRFLNLTQLKKEIYNVFCGKQMMRSSRICWAQKNHIPTTLLTTYIPNNVVVVVVVEYHGKFKPFSFELLYFILKIPCPKKIVFRN